jgi:murein DD-endopeptidase MepM/ murein hydrolase activator NlpD
MRRIGSTAIMLTMLATASIAAGPAAGAPRVAIAESTGRAPERPEPAALTVVGALAGQVGTWVTRAVTPPVAIPPDLTALTSFPVPDHTSSGFGWRDDPIRHRRQFHAGTDIRAPRGTRVYVAGDGHVIFAGRQHGYGKVVYVDHGGGIVTRYAHLSRIEVDRGEDVTAATEIGRVGSTGRATGPHLHFEVRIDGRPVNPVLAMQVAGLERTNPDMAALLGVALAPAVQSRWINAEDPPRHRSHHGHHGHERHHHPTHRSHHVS